MWYRDAHLGALGELCVGRCSRAARNSLRLRHRRFAYRRNRSVLAAKRATVRNVRKYPARMHRRFPCRQTRVCWLVHIVLYIVRKTRAVHTIAGENLVGERGASLMLNRSVRLQTVKRKRGATWEKGLLPSPRNFPMTMVGVCYVDFSAIAVYFIETRVLVV